MLTYDDVIKSEAIRTYIIRADESLDVLGFTDHSFSHVVHVAQTAGYILEALGFDARTVELAKIAGYLHDIGNLVNRNAKHIATLPPSLNPRICALSILWAFIKSWRSSAN